MIIVQTIFQGLDSLVSSAVESTVAQVLGRGTVEAFYSYLQNGFGIKEQEIVSKPEVFSKAVDKAFGKGGQVIQRIIIKNICKALGIAPNESCSNDLAALVIELRKRSESQAEICPPFV